MSDRYRVGFDAGNGDEACFTLLRWLCDEWHIEVRAYGTTAQRLNAAFQAEADLTAALYAANERARVAEAERDFERKVSEWLAKRGRACLGMPECDVFFEEREDKPECKKCWRDALAAAREALRSEESDTASE